MSEWTVTITLATAAPIEETLLEALADAAEQFWGATVSTRFDGPGFVLHIDLDGNSPLHAIEEAVDLARKVADPLIPTELVGVNAQTPEHAAMYAFSPDTPELLAATDVAELLGVTRQRVHQLASEHAQFPAPYVRLGSGPIWTRPAIDNFARIWTRKPGRPPARKAG